MTPTRRTGILLALATALISGFSVFLNSYGVKAFGNPTAYTTGEERRLRPGAARRRRDRPSGPARASG